MVALFWSWPLQVAQMDLKVLKTREVEVVEGMLWYVEYDSAAFSFSSSPFPYPCGVAQRCLAITIPPEPHTTFGVLDAPCTDHFQTYVAVAVISYQLWGGH